jgi:hypothetical protein
MAKDSIPEVLPTGPQSLSCPYCGAKPKKDCQKSKGGFAQIHLARIRAAALVDTRERKCREDMNKATARTHS